MPLQLIMDVHVPRQITRGLRRRGVDVITAQEDGSAKLPDSELLDRATGIARVLFSQDRDLLIEATARQLASIHFSGVIYAPQLSITIGRAVVDLELIAKVYDPSDTADRVEFLPL